MKTMVLPHKRSNQKIKPFYSMSLQEREARMREILNNANESTTLVEDRRKILMQIREKVR